MALSAYGFLAQVGHSGIHEAPHPVIDHLMGCGDAEALDFIEFCFQSRNYTGDQAGVDELNALFDEVGLAYQLTPYSRIPVPHEQGPLPHIRVGQAFRVLLPQIIRRDHQLLHKEVVEPTLHLLRNRRLTVANDEMLRAQAEYRAGNWAECISLAGSAFESVMKTICTERDWKYNPNDNCGDLVDVLYRNKLFWSFYVEPLKSVGTLRNKMSASHGRGPMVEAPPRKEHAANVLHLASAHALFLCRLAGMQ